MPGLDPGIHVLPSPNKKGADGRVIFAKTRFALLPGHDEVCPFLRERYNERRIWCTP